MSRIIVHRSTVTRTGTSRAAKSSRAKFVTVAQPSIARYASGVQTVVTGVARSG